MLLSLRIAVIFLTTFAAMLATLYSGELVPRPCKAHGTHVFQLGSGASGYSPGAPAESAAPRSLGRLPSATTFGTLPSGSPDPDRAEPVHTLPLHVLGKKSLPVETLMLIPVGKTIPWLIVCLLMLMMNFSSGGGRENFNYRIPPAWSPETEGQYSFRAYMTDVSLWIMLTD